MSDSTTLFEGIFEGILEEGLLLNDKASFWWDELPAILGAIKKAQPIVKKYLAAAKKITDDYEYPVIEVQVNSNSVLRNLLNSRKKDSNIKKGDFSFGGKVIITDGNGIVPELLKDSWIVATIPYKGQYSD